MLKILFVSSTLEGGIGTIQKQLACALGQLNVEVSLWTTSSHLLDVPGCDVKYFKTMGPAQLGYSRSMEIELRRKYRDFDILHVHGFWTAHVKLISLWKSLTERPSFFSIHGALHPHIFSRLRFKKTLARILFHDKAFNAASVLHAASKIEYLQVRDHEDRHPVMLVPNGIELTKPPFDIELISTELQKLYSSNKVLLYLSRLHPTKGIELLIESINCLELSSPGAFNGWQLVIAGSGTEKYKQSLLRKIDSAGLSAQITLIGFVDGNTKSFILSESQSFVLPSFSESFPLAVLEAMLYELPVLTTTGTPFDFLDDDGAGWYCRLNRDSISAALLDMCEKSDVELIEMGANGLSVLQRDYDIDKVALKYLNSYMWSLGRCPKPDSIMSAAIM